MLSGCTASYDQSLRWAEKMKNWQRTDGLTNPFALSCNVDVPLYWGSKCSSLKTMTYQFKISQIQLLIQSANALVNTYQYNSSEKWDPRFDEIASGRCVPCVELSILEERQMSSNFFAELNYLSAHAHIHTPVTKWKLVKPIRVFIPIVENKKERICFGSGPGGANMFDWVIALSWYRPARFSQPTDGVRVRVFHRLMNLTRMKRDINK